MCEEKTHRLGSRKPPVKLLVKYTAPEGVRRREEHVRALAADRLDAGVVACEVTLFSC